MGIVEAAEKFGVRETLEGLHETGVALKEAKVGATGAKDGAELLKKLANLGISLEDVDDFVKKLVVASKEYDITDIVENAQRLHNLETKHHKEYGELVKDYETKAKQISELDEQSKRLRKEVKQIELEREKKLNVAKVTENHLDEYLKTKASLAKHGMNFSNIESISTVLDNIREHDHDYRRTIKTVKDTESLGKKLKDLTREVEDKKEEVSSFSDTIKEYRELHREYNKLLGYGLTLANIRKLNSIAVQYSDPEEFFGEVMGAFEEYGGLLGIQKEFKKVEKQKEEEQIKLSTVLAKHDLTSALVEKFGWLREQGVGDHEILRIHGITSKYGSNILVEIVEKSVELSELESDVQKLSERVSELKTQESQIEGRIDGRQRTLAQLDSQVAEFPNTVKEAQMGVDAALALIKSEITGLKDSVSAEITSSDEKLKSFTADAKTNLDSFIAQVEKLAKNTMETGVQIGKLQALAPLLGVLIRMEGSSSIVHLAVRTILENYRSWLAGQQALKTDFLHALHELIIKIPYA